MIGAIAPCQLTGNISAIMYYGNRSLQQSIAWLENVAYILGKILVFSLLGIIVWSLGETFQTKMTIVFPIIRKTLGPLLILIGFYMLGILKIKWTIKMINLENLMKKKVIWNAFLLGCSFSIMSDYVLFVFYFTNALSFFHFIWSRRPTRYFCHRDGNSFS